MAQERRTRHSRSPGPGLPMLRQRIAHVMAGRLGIAVVLLAVALGITAEGAAGERAERGLYATVVFAFFATIAFASVHRFVRRVAAFGALQLATDIAVVTSLVYFSGGSESIFAFLYVPITVYAALLYGRFGAYAAGAGSSLAYGGLLLAVRFGGLPGGDPEAAPDALQFALWGVHSGALLLVALLASALSRERDRAGDELDQRDRDLASLRFLHERTVDSLMSGLLTTDSEGHITSFNPEAERITGHAARDVLGAPLGDVIPGAPPLVLESAAPGERPGRLRARMRFQNGRGDEVHLGLAGSVLRGENGGRGGHVVIFQDVTDVVTMESELRRQERLAATGQLAAALAHEIRNPLASISGSVQMLHGPGNVFDADERHRLMEIVLRETDRLNALISDFLVYARPAPSRCLPIVVSDVAAEVLEMFEPVRPEGVEITLEAPPQLAALVDEGELRQLLWNLCLNAAQAMPEGGRLGVCVADVPQGPSEEGRKADEERQHWVEVSVADTGAGIASELLDRIFDPFFTTKKNGTGLGLATVHRIVDGNGGHLSVESELHRGTCFRIRLPRAEGRA